jgi:hypothetical protein
MKNLGDSPPAKCKDKYKRTASTVHGKEGKKRQSKVASNVQASTFDRTTTSKDEDKKSGRAATLFSNVETKPVETTANTIVEDKQAGILKEESLVVHPLQASMPCYDVGSSAKMEKFKGSASIEQVAEGKQLFVECISEYLPGENQR